MSERPTQAPDAGYFAKKLTVILRDINLYTKPELYRELSRLAEVAKPDEANSSHAQEVEEQEVLKLAEGIWHYAGGMLDNEAFKAKLFAFASKLREKDAELLRCANVTINSLHLSINNLQATIAQQKEEIEDLWNHLRDSQNRELEAFRELSISQEQVKRLRETLSEVDTWIDADNEEAAEIILKALAATAPKGGTE